MTLNEWLGLYFCIGLIVGGLSWFRVHMMGLGDQLLCVLTMTLLWLPLLIVLILALLFWRHRPEAFRRETPAWKRRREMNALKDKHGVDDADVTARVIEGLKARETHWR